MHTPAVWRFQAPPGMSFPVRESVPGGQTAHARPSKWVLVPLTCNRLHRGQFSQVMFLTSGVCCTEGPVMLRGARGGALVRAPEGLTPLGCFGIGLGRHGVHPR